MGHRRPRARTASTKRPAVSPGLVGGLCPAWAAAGSTAQGLPSQELVLEGGEAGAAATGPAVAVVGGFGTPADGELDAVETSSRPRPRMDRLISPWSSSRLELTPRLPLSSLPL